MEAPLQLSQENIKKTFGTCGEVLQPQKSQGKRRQLPFFAHIFTFWQSDLFSFISQKFTLMDFTSEQNY